MGVPPPHLLRKPPQPKEGTPSMGLRPDQLRNVQLVDAARLRNRAKAAEETPGPIAHSQACTPQAASKAGPATAKEMPPPECKLKVKAPPPHILSDRLRPDQ